VGRRDLRTERQYFKLYFIVPPDRFATGVAGKVLSERGITAAVTSSISQFVFTYSLTE
jgi:hypothetical protein